MKNKRVLGRCPICGRAYTGKNIHTRHHVFYPKKDYKTNILVDMCVQCHEDFNCTYKFCRIPSAFDCLMNLLRFVKNNGKNAITIYPQLI